MTDLKDRRVKLLLSAAAAASALVLGVVVAVAIPAGALPPVGTITVQAGTGLPLPVGPWPGPATSGNINDPQGLAYDPLVGSVFIADTLNCEVLEDTLATGNTQVVVDAPHVCGGPSPAGTPAVAALIGRPHGLAVDQLHNLLYIADPNSGGVDVVNLATMKMKGFIPVFPAAGGCTPEGLDVNQATGTLYVADTGCEVVFQIPYLGAPAVLAGTLHSAGFFGNGGLATAALLNSPSGVAYDATTGNVYIADSANNEIRVVALGVINDYVGDSGGLPGCSPDGSPATSKINDPVAVRTDPAGDLFFDEDGCELVRDVAPGPGPLNTVAGEYPGPGSGFNYNGDPANTVALASGGPHGLALVPTASLTNEDVWFADSGNNVVDSVAGAAQLAAVGPSSISHFTCYTATEATPPPFAPPPAVLLIDQFARRGFSATVGAVIQHCNPAQKTVGTGSAQRVYPIVNPDDHLLCFSLKAAPQAPYNVQVTNQFGIADMTTGQPSRLCAPSWKDEPATDPIPCVSVPAGNPSGCVPLPQTQVQPPGLDHYVCYTAKYTPSATALPRFTLPKTMTLQDQFMPGAVPANLANPNLLCVPTAKIITPGIPPTPVVNPNAHLVCFPVPATSAAPVQPQVVTDQNQFGMGTVTPTALDELCVPSFKQIIVNSLPTPTTGTLVLTAVDANGIGLRGATFSAMVPGPAGGGGTVAGMCTTDFSGQCEIDGLTPGTYDVSETGAPSQYTAPSDQNVSVSGGFDSTASFFDIFTE